MAVTIETSPVRAVDRLVAAFNGLYAVLWISLWPEASYAPAMAAVHGVAAWGMPRLLARLPDPPARPVGFLREVYPLIWIGAFWSELDPLNVLLHSASHDALARTVDLALFGIHLNEVWMPAMPQLWFSEAMHLVYFLYYPLIFLPPLVMLLRGRDAALQDMVFRLMVTYFGCYVSYLLFPVYGPLFLTARHAGPLTDGFFYNLVETVRGSGDVHGAALPSSHVAGATTVALLGWRWLGRTGAWALTLQAVGVAMATVYTQNHYAVDAVTGVAWALLLQASVPRLRALFSPGFDRLPLPVLPAPARRSGRWA